MIKAEIKRLKVKGPRCSVKGCNYPAIERVRYEDEDGPMTFTLCRDHLKEFLKLRGIPYKNLLEEGEMTEETKQVLMREQAEVEAEEKEERRLERLKDLLKLIWPKAPEEERFKAAALCASYRLNPLMKHVFLIPFEDHKTGETSWVTVLGINATRTLARRTKPFGYVDGPRVMTDDEQKRIFGKVEPDKIWAITVLRDKDGNEAPGYGCWPRNKRVYGDERGNTAENMAFIRAERNALQKLCPAEMPPAEFEAMEEQFAPPIELPKELPWKEPSKEEVKEKPKPEPIQPTLQEVKGKNNQPPKLFEL